MFKKILVPTDGSQLALSAATTAAQLARTHGAQVVGVTVIDPFPYNGFGDAAIVGLQAYLADARLVAGQALDALGRVFVEAGVPFSGETVERAQVYEGVIEAAEAEGCDLIVMASHGRQGVKALILGSVAQKVLTHTRVPVLIVKG